MIDPLAIERAVEEASSELSRFLEERLGPRTPCAAITMGSGLGGFSSDIEAPLRVPCADLPRWPTPAVEGHAGEVLIGTLSGRPIIAFAGRVHRYEGWEGWEVTFYVRVLGALGVPILILSNASGVVREGWHPGELMLISDHLNLMGWNPLVGPVVGAETRFPDLTEAYDAELRETIEGAAADLGTTLRTGVYAGVLGPSFETPAEIRMFRLLGADAVGMSSVPEVIQARALGIRCAAISCFTNYAAGMTGQSVVTHEEVYSVAAGVEDDLGGIVKQAVSRLP